MMLRTNRTQEQLPLWPARDVDDVLTSFVGPCALEDDDFPFESISDVAEVESWRKEINRPSYHIHKWWARRLGTVFRAICLGALMPSGTDILDAFYRPIRARDRIVFDPFMGSGTTIGEVVKLGARAIGRDINPVAYFLVRNALAVHDYKAVLQTLRNIERDVADKIRAHYKTVLPDGTQADVLYFFWVKQVDCPRCAAPVDLFSSRIFAKHVYPHLHPYAKAVCPACGEVNPVRYDASLATCVTCSLEFNPQSGPVNGRKVICPSCYHSFSIAKTIRKNNTPPVHRLYAKLVLMPNGNKIYAAATDDDRKSYAFAEKELESRPNTYPIARIEAGYNTNQALGYNYRYWHEMFNARQLLCLSLLAERIREIQEPALRELFTCLFSGVLEFNNLFTSYKGEGTGAVRHMFAHHILKPERVPLEANLWGTPKSSGSFISMFQGRICRALDYVTNTFELRLQSKLGEKKKSERVYGLSESLGCEIAEDFVSFKNGKQVYLSCGDSSVTDIDDGTVNAIITDPPFFDNVHYSQLADFFYVWQRHILGAEGMRSISTTRSPDEVQTADLSVFIERLGSVWSECHRVLADDGVLTFTYHHSRSEGWIAVLHALMEAGFYISAAFPIKAEMSVAMPKRQTKEPIDLDIVLVCRKRSALKKYEWSGNLWEMTYYPKAASQIARLRKVGRSLSRNDVRIIIMAQFIHYLSRSHTLEAARSLLKISAPEIESMIESLYHTNNSESAEVNS